MQKQQLFTICKQLKIKKKKSTTMANHTCTIFEKNGKRLIAHYSPYSENLWDLYAHTYGESGICIRDLSELNTYFA